ncbi:hypothetical protein [Sphingomonas sp. UYP23]
MEQWSTTEPIRALSLAEQRLLGVLPPVIGLEANEGLWIGNVRDAVALDTNPPTLKTALFLTPEMRTEDVDRRSAIERLAYGTLQQLAISRAWRNLGTFAPPWSAFTGNALWSALINADIVAPQKVVDRIRRAVSNDGLDPADPRAPWTSWRTAGAIPVPLEGVRNIGAGHQVTRREDEPWHSGCYHDDQIVVLGYGNGEGFAIRPIKTIKRAHRSRIVYEIGTERKIPETILTAAAGRPVTDLVDEKLVRELGGKILSGTARVRTTRLRVEAELPLEPGMPVEHAVELAKQLAGVIWRVPAVADEVERALLGHDAAAS